MAASYNGVLCSGEKEWKEVKNKLNLQNRLIRAKQAMWRRVCIVRCISCVNEQK